LLRLQAVAVGRTQPVRRVIVFNSGSPPFSGYSRSEAVGTPEQLPGLVASLVMAEPAPVSLKKVTDVLVCTHGSRDTCCGSLGTRLWRDLEDGLEGIRVWRTSHTGGHRFAPNAITFPDGNYWGYLDVEVLHGVVNRSMSADVAAAHLRGCAAFSPKVQVADRAVLARRGWGWLGCYRSGEELSSHRVELTFESFDGERGGYLVGVEETRMMPVPDCGGDPANAAKFHPEFAVSHLEVSM
jgi:hypothetical protein